MSYIYSLKNFSVIHISQIAMPHPAAELPSHEQRPRQVNPGPSYSIA